VDGLTVLTAALALSERNLAVFPLHPRGKTPACAHGFKDATRDADIIREWWRATPNYNIGVATGSASGGLLVVDVDDGCAGESALDALELAHEPLPASVGVITPGDDAKLPGRHIWLRLPPGSTIGNSAGRLGPHLDTRCDGGYVVAPPSMGPLGRRYRWSCDGASSIVTAPQWLLDLLRAPAATRSAATVSAEWRDLIERGIPEGRRNDSLTRLTGYLLRRRVDPAVTRELIHSFNTTHCAPPLPDKDVERIAESITGRELRRRESGNG
jgi:hypothetical protein